MLDPKEKAELLADHFEDKLTARRDGKKAPIKTVAAELQGKFKVGHMQLQPKITREEVHLAAQDLPKKEAVGPDEFPAEFYKQCPALHEILAHLFNGTIEQNLIPEQLTTD